VQAIKAAMAKARSRQQMLQKSPTAFSPNEKAVPMALQSVEVSTSKSSSTNPEIQVLQVEIGVLRQENRQLKTEVDSLKRQVAQIMTFIRQKLK
jgi:FtsZ-binding cell division protein ZapB